MPSFATALLLGGLRGPLVMILWTSSESQKAEKKLEDFDTKVEWIRLLQPEFDSVHIFQVWNKAYNISVQMASLANKYATILDALDYAHRIQRQRPNNINIEIAIADVYFNKLGSSTEKEYYRRRVMQDTQWRQQVGAKPGEVGWRRTRMDPVLDAQGNILPAHAEELAYLKKYEPFPHGLPPFGLAYNYYRRAQILQSEGGQSHLQLSQQVLDSRPALTLKNWSESLVEQGRRLELQMFDKPIPAERTDMELPTAPVALGETIAKPELVDEAIYDYRRAAQLASDSIDAYARHLRNYGESINLSTFSSHLDHVTAIRHLAEGDANYLAAMRAKGNERASLVQAARSAYEKAVIAAERVELKYFVDDGMLAAVHLRKTDVPGMSDAQIRQGMAMVRDAYAKQLGGQINAEDRQEYEGYVQRAEARLAQLAKG
jgi:tetratricopeptide (TPR) repeat protein